MNKFSSFIVNIEKSLSNAFQHILFILSISLFIVSVGFTLILIISNFDIPWNLFARNDYSNFTKTYSLPIGLFVTWLAITTLFFTVRRIIQTDKQLQLMDKQRQMTYQPDLMVGECFINSECQVPIRNDIINTITSPGQISYNEWESVRIVLFNVGLATAKNIKSSFNYNAEEVAKLINEFKSIVDVEVTGGVVYVTLHRKNETYTICYSLDCEFDYEYINYILPEGKISNNITSIHLPDSYINLLLIYYSLLRIKGRGLGYFLMTIENFTKLYLTLEYYDMEYNGHTSKFVIDFKFDFSNFYSLISEDVDQFVKANNSFKAKARPIK